MATWIWRSRSGHLRSERDELTSGSAAGSSGTRIPPRKGRSRGRRPVRCSRRSGPGSRRSRRDRGWGPGVTLLALATTDRGLCGPAEPVVRADDEALLRGLAAFETLRVYGGRPFRLAAHLERLVASSESVGLPLLPREELERLAEI